MSSLNVSCTNCGSSDQILIDLNDLDFVVCKECDEEFSLKDLQSRAFNWVRAASKIQGIAESCKSSSDKAP